MNKKPKKTIKKTLVTSFSFCPTDWASSLVFCPACGEKLEIRATKEKRTYFGGVVIKNIKGKAEEK